MLFQNRIEAGKKLAIKLSSPDGVDGPSGLAESLRQSLDALDSSRVIGPRYSRDRQGRGYQAIESLIVLGIPRGGVVIGRELAKKLSCPLDVIVTKKIGAPGNPELAIGAVGPEGEEVVDEELAEKVGADEKYLKKQIAKIKTEIITKRMREYRGDKPPLGLKDKIVILADDGVATGATMLAAIEVVRQHEPKKIVVAVPVIARDSLKKIEKLADEVVYLDAPRLFFAVGQFYREFPQIKDKEAIKLLE